MVECSNCGEHVSSALLRIEHPKCLNGHDLGAWTSCGNKDEKHVYLSYKDSKCPYCGSPSDSRVKEGTKVKCLHINTNGVVCSARAYLWFKEGPPCYMNHLGKMKIES